MQWNTPSARPMPQPRLVSMLPALAQLFSVVVFLGAGVAVSEARTGTQVIANRETPPRDPKPVDHDPCLGGGSIDVDEFETWIHRRLAGNVVGYGFAISQGGVPVGFGQGGFAQIPVLGSNVLFTFLTDIQVASVSKPITAIALLQLMDKLDRQPEDAISGYLPQGWKLGPGFDDAGITFEDLLTHQTGFEQVIAEMINNAEEKLPSPNTWEGLQLLVANGIPKESAATSCPKANEDGTFTLGEPEPPQDGHYGVQCYKNANYALARELIWRMALESGDLDLTFDELDPALMPMASASGYQKYAQDHVLAPAGVFGACKASAPPATRSMMYDVNGNVPFVMLTAGADAYSDDASDLLECGPFNWSLSALDLVRIMGELSCGQLLDDPYKNWMRTRNMGLWNSATYPDRYWHNGGWTKTSSNAQQLLWPLHPDHPDNDPMAPEEDCFNVGADLVCPATGSATNKILSCVVEFEPFGVDAALVINSELRDDPDVSACDVLHGAFDELF